MSAQEECLSCSLGAFVLITHSVYGVQCFLTENWGFVNVFLPTLDPSFLVVGDNRCNFAVYKGIHCKVKRQQHNYGKTDYQKVQEQQRQEYRLWQDLRTPGTSGHDEHQ